MSRRSRPKKTIPAKKSSEGSPREAGERLQKVLAAAGVGSRRHCEELILAGRVEVDGSVVTELGTRVDPGREQLRVDGVKLTQPRRVYYALNKPSGVVCTNRDPSGRPRATDLIPGRPERLFTVGRLDLNSEGLILLTNDGELANRLTHPRYGVQKTYRVLVAGHPTSEVVSRLRKGVQLAEGLAKIAVVRVKRRHKQSTIMEVVLEEGRNREIRRLLARVGHKVLQLVRIAIGPLRLGNLASGEYRRLSREEVSALRRAAKVAVGR
ncbi:MAG: pseudouridine synthase [Planctomycetota bacterium]